MKDLIKDFPNQLEHALKIASEAQLRNHGMRPANVLITGLGGSGISASIVKDLCEATARVPIAVNKGYTVPHWVGAETLLIASSYSGNTEETLEASLKGVEYGAMMAAITSGGQLKKICEERGLNHIVIPGGNPPRSMLAYSFVQLFRILSNYHVQIPDWESEIAAAVEMLRKEQADIEKKAESLAKSVSGRMLVTYATHGLGGVATRWRQQFNENAKTLGWDAEIPELNHNELVGWAGGDDKLAVFVLQSEDEHPRNSMRAEKNIELFKKHTSEVHKIQAKGASPIARALYTIHLGDWISLHLSEINGADIMDIDVIESLKAHLQNKSS